MLKNKYETEMVVFLINEGKCLTVTSEIREEYKEQFGLCNGHTRNARTAMRKLNETVYINSFYGLVDMFRDMETVDTQVSKVIMKYGKIQEV